MILDTNKIFYGPLTQIINRTYKDSETIIVRTKTICPSLFYQIDDEWFLDLITKEKYTSNTSINFIGDCTINKAELKSINMIFDKLDIILPKKIKTSSKKLNLIKQIIINESIYISGNKTKEEYDQFKQLLNLYCNNLRNKQKKKSLYIKREN